MFLVGFWVVANIIYIAMVNAGDISITIILIVAIVVGLIAGCCLACCWHLGIYVLAALFGYALALWILSWKAGGLITSPTGRIILIVVLVVVSVILMFFFEKPMIILSTSFVGGFLIIFGIDLFAQTGFATLVASFLESNSTPSQDALTWQIYILLAGVLLLAIIGCVVQWHFHREVDYRTKAMAPYGYGSKWGRRSTANATT